MTAKPKSQSEYKEVTYPASQWKILKDLRQKASQIMLALEQFHLQSVVHGSIARGDVHKDSDVDVFIAEIQNSFQIETALEKAKIKPNQRLIIQATPTYAMKAYIEIDEKVSVSFPLMEMRRLEREFYKFGGEINLTQLKSNVRVAGIDKRLMLIEPTGIGHVESSVVGKEEFAAKTLGISAETVFNRVRTLMKRDQVGRTGVFLKRELAEDETFELALKKIADENPAVRRRMKKIRFKRG
jgi:uncharacterized protein